MVGALIVWFGHLPVVGRCYEFLSVWTKKLPCLMGKVKGFSKEMRRAGTAQAQLLSSLDFLSRLSLKVLKRVC